jgi:SAM-dependent methyltransferase
MASEPKDVWAIGEDYQSYVGRWSRLTARDFIAWLAIPRDRQWLDVGCGTGALSATILEHAAPRQVLGVDPSDGFVAYARHKVCDPRASFQVGNVQDLPVSSEAFDVAVAGLVVNFIPDQPRAVREMTRATLTGGMVAAYVWDYAGEMQMMRRFWDAATALDPAAVPLDEGRRFPLCQPEPLAGLFGDAGLADVQVAPIEVPTLFKDFDDYWTPFLGGQGPAPGYCMSLSEDRRRELRNLIRDNLPTRNDGSIHLMARAWAVRGVVP